MFNQLGSLVCLSVTVCCCTCKGQTELELFELPLTQADLKTVQMPLTAFQAIVGDRIPTKLILHGLAETRNYQHLRSFFAFLDSQLSVKGIARRDGEVYWVFRKAGNSRKTRTGTIYVPIVLNSIPTEGNHDPVQLSLTVLKDAFDSVDETRQPFAFAGTAATEYIDFKHPNTMSSKAEWQHSLVLFTSLGGDALIVKGDGASAWFQLETNKIFPAGKVRDAIERYIQAILEDREFSSWTDRQR